MKKQSWFFILVCIFFVIVILIRYFLVINSEDNLKRLRDTEKNIEIVGKIVGQPNLRADNIQYTLLTNSEKEKILVSLPLYPKYLPGDRIKINGKLQTPAEFEDFSYKDYLLKDGIRTVSYYPETKLLKEKHWTFYGLVLRLKNKLQEVNKKILPSPENEILGAMILGEKGLLPDEIKDAFSKVGLSHVLAISGMHIAVIVQILISIFNQTKLSNRSFYLISGFLIFYVILIGAPPSAVRASVMAGILLLAAKVHRQYVAHRALVIAGFFMLLFNPLLIRHDVGFQLSFLAVLGILELGKPLESALGRFKGPNWLSELLAITLSAQIFTLPIIIWNFGIFSLISPIANIIVVPLLPIVISLGFLTLLTGLVSTSIGIFVAFPLYLILSFIIWLADFFSGLKLSFIEVKNINFLWVLFLYLLIFAITWKIKYKN